MDFWVSVYWRGEENNISGFYVSSNTFGWSITNKMVREKIVEYVLTTLPDDVIVFAGNAAVLEGEILRRAIFPALCKIHASGYIMHNEGEFRDWASGKL